MKEFVKVFIVSLFIGNSFCQEIDSTSYTLYKDHPTVFGDVGYNSAPFSMKYDFGNGIDKVKYRHNFKTMLGFGFAYKWFSLRLSGAVIGNSRPVSRFGEANYIDLGLNFSFKKTHYEVNLRTYSGYVVVNAKDWDTTLNDLKPNDITQTIGSYNLSLAMWYFHNKNFKISPFNGVRGKYNKPVTTWYLAGKFDIYGLQNEKGSIIPKLLIDTTNSKTASSSLAAVDLGVIPGVGHVGTIKKNWQYGAMFAFGPRLQLKSYTLNGTPTSLLGIVARYDIQMMFGYNVPKFFAIFSLEFDNKSIGFLQMKYHQSFYSMRLSLGYRFKERKKVKKEKV